MSRVIGHVSADDLRPGSAEAPLEELPDAEDRLLEHGPEPDFSPESTRRGGGCPDEPSKQAAVEAFGQKLIKSYQNHVNFSQISFFRNFRESMEI